MCVVVAGVEVSSKEATSGSSVNTGSADTTALDKSSPRLLQ